MATAGRRRRTAPASLGTLSAPTAAVHPIVRKRIAKPASEPRFATVSRSGTRNAPTAIPGIVPTVRGPVSVAAAVRMAAPAARPERLSIEGRVAAVTEPIVVNGFPSPSAVQLRRLHVFFKAWQTAL